MRAQILTTALTSIFAAASALPQELERQMNVRLGPETVFQEPVTQIFPTLADAKPTGENGRVGNELVFWGYDLADGREVFLFACALVANVNCEERVPLICTTSTNVLETRELGGTVTQRNCRDIAIASPGDTRPGCTQREQSTPVRAGLVSCG
jgi:hypothetical protein